MRLGDTRSFCIGSAERFIGIGLPNVAPPSPGRHRAVTGGTPRMPLKKRDASAETPVVPQRPRNSDLETLEAVLNMDISDIASDESESMTVEVIEFKYNDVGAILEPEIADAAPPDPAGEVSGSSRRRRRRGGRGRGRRRPGDGAEDGAPVSDVASGSESGTVNAAGPDESVNPDNVYSDTRNSITEKNVWASEYDRELELPHAESGPSTHSEGDSSL